MKPTIEQIYAALVLSEAHHLDGVMCDESNYRKFDDTVEKCALCSICIEYTTFGKRCTICVLHDEETACCKEWVSAHGAKDFVDFHTKQTALYKRIRRLKEEYEEKLKGESKCSEQSKFAENLNNALEKTQKAVKQYNLVREHNKSEQPKFKQGDSAMFCGEKVEILGLKETGNFAGKYRIRNWGVKHKGFYASESELSPISSKQPKFAVGDKVWWNGESTTTIQLESQIVELGSVLANSTSVKLKDNMVLMVSFDSLSPLPKMFVGRKWILKQKGNVWNDLLVECAREDDKHGKYEQIVSHGSSIVNKGEVNDMMYPSEISRFHNGETRFIIICIDPAFWTGEICGEKVRVYEDEHSDYVYVIYQYDGSRHNINNLSDSFTRLVLAAIKDANIPIMTHSQSQGNYLPPEEE